MLISTFTWATNASGVFNNAQNWTDQNGHHGVPGAADTAIIKGAGFTVSINQATTVGSLSSSAQIAVTSGSLTLDRPGQASSIASLVLDAKTSLSVADGSLTLSGNSTLAGTLNAASGTSIAFTGGEQNVDAGTVFAGSGNYIIENGDTLAMATNLTMANLQVAGGTVVGSGSLKVTTCLEFDGGEISPAVVSIPAGSTFSIDNAGNDGSYGWILGAGTVTLAGETDWAVNDAGDLQLGNNTIVNNLSSGAFNIETDSAMVGGTINNLGQVTKMFGPGGWHRHCYDPPTTLNNAGKGRGPTRER